MVGITDVVRSELQNYADRGIFQNFSVARSGSKNLNFKFNWLTENSFSLLLNVDKSQLELQNLLPAVPYRSDMDKAFRNFLIGRSDLSVPVHRRLDDKRFTFQVKNRDKNLSVIISFSEEDAAEAAKTTVNLLHEIFNNFLVEGPYQNYMVEFFNEPEE